jgi:hypothetical protein
MNIPAWQIVTWPPVAITVSELKRLRGFNPLGWSSRIGEDGRLLGNVLWVSDEAPRRVGLAWEWCESAPNVFVMSDPMTVLSNVKLTDDDGEASEFKRVLYLNNAIYKFPWQKHVRSLTRPSLRTLEAVT